MAYLLIAVKETAQTQTLSCTQRCLSIPYFATCAARTIDFQSQNL